MQGRARVLWGSSAIAVLAFASYWSVRLARADVFYRANTLEAIARAVALDPANARYHAWRAELEEHEGLDPTGALLRAAALNPRDSQAWIQLGLHAEMEGDFADAEKHLLEAARVDRLFRPRATLMEFYFRRGDRERFWLWAKRAFEMSYGDRTSLFRLSWRTGDDAERIRRAMPSDPEFLAWYLRFLMLDGRMEAAAPVARELVARAGPSETAVLLDYCDRLLAQGEVTAALAIWNNVRGQSLAPEKGVLLTNGDFAAPPLGRGFDWQVSALDAVTAVRRPPPGGLEFSLSGKQPERCELLWQQIPLLPRRTYRLGFRYRTSGIPAESGLRWRILDAATPQLSSEEWRQEQLGFPSGDARLARLVLTCERPPGSPRAQGTIVVAGVTLELMP
jgi:tetratricopeptide (TPR) repeat protein